MHNNNNFFDWLCQKGCALLIMTVHGTMISSLPRGCSRIRTCPGSGGSIIRSRWRTVCARIRTSTRCSRREYADHACVPPDLPVQPFDHVVRVDAPAVPRGIFGRYPQCRADEIQIR